jgi:tetratricopeptide (TPR) repeat protein
MKETQSRFRALGNMGDVLIKMEQVEEAIKVYQKQLTLSKQTREKTFEATAYGSLGVCHRLSKQFDKALGYHTQVRNLYHKYIYHRQLYIIFRNGRMKLKFNNILLY